MRHMRDNELSKQESGETIYIKHNFFWQDPEVIEGLWVTLRNLRSILSKVFRLWLLAKLLINNTTKGYKNKEN